MLLEQVNKRLESFKARVESTADVKLRADFAELKRHVDRLRERDHEVEDLKGKLRGARLELAESLKFEETEPEQGADSTTGEHDIDDVLVRSKNVSGKTVGLQLTEDIRARLLAQKDQWKADTFRQIVTVAVELGLSRLEDERPLATIDVAAVV